ncbi:MAG: helix-turn-helix domain-containing protein [Desulfohalobiaceae bacterium]|nr:helix-turn-helix domain-containing protein [Desulfohalobiaceae bacterium]
MTPVQNQSQLAEKLNVGRAAVSLAKQKDSVPSKWIFFLAQEFSLNSDWLATGNGSPYPVSKEQSHGCAKVPHILPRLSGDGSLLFDEHFTEKIHFNSDWLSSLGNPNEMVSLTMTGPCMHPEIKEKDMVLIHLGDKKMFSGGIFALAIDGFILIRRTEKSPGHLELQCDNPDYPNRSLPREEAEGITLLGKVIWAGREHSL